MYEINFGEMCIRTDCPTKSAFLLPIYRILYREKQDLIQSYDKKLFTNRKFENKWTTQKRHQKIPLNNDCGSTLKGQLELQQSSNWCG